jgi:hypothetical protein
MRAAVESLDIGDGGGWVCVVPAEAQREMVMDMPHKATGVDDCGQEGFSEGEQASKRLKGAHEGKRLKFVNARTTDLVECRNRAVLTFGSAARVP